MKRASVIARRALGMVAGSTFIALVAYSAGAWHQEAKDLAARDATIAFRWGDGKCGEAFYGMRVFEVDAANGVDLRATVVIGPGGSMWHDCGLIGRAASHQEAVRRFSVISWRPDGVHVGSDARDEYFLDRAIVEAHR